MRMTWCWSRQVPVSAMSKASPGAMRARWVRTSSRSPRSAFASVVPKKGSEWALTEARRRSANAGAAGAGAGVPRRLHDPDRVPVRARHCVTRPVAGTAATACEELKALGERTIASNLPSTPNKCSRREHLKWHLWCDLVDGVVAERSIFDVVDIRPRLQF